MSGTKAADFNPAGYLASDAISFSRAASGFVKPKIGRDGRGKPPKLGGLTGSWVDVQSVGIALPGGEVVPMGQEVHVDADSVSW